MSTRTPTALEWREKEPQSQLLALPEVPEASSGWWSELKRTILKARGESVRKQRRWASGVAEREGKGMGTASLGREQEEEEEEEMDSDEGLDDDGLEKMM